MTTRFWLRVLLGVPLKILPHLPPGAERGSGVCETYGISVGSDGFWKKGGHGMADARLGCAGSGVGGLTLSAPRGEARGNSILAPSLCP